MELTDEQIEEFKKIHEKYYGGPRKYTDEELREIANGIANYHWILFKICERVKKEGGPDASTLP